MLNLKKAVFFSLLAFLPVLAYAQSPIACECDQYQVPVEVPSIIVQPPVQPSVVPPQPQPAPSTPSVAPPVTQAETVRAAIDIGSGATKLRVAEVNIKDHKIDRILVNESFPVHYQEHLMKSGNNTFDDQVMQQGIDAIKKGVALAKQNHAERVIAVATASFRKAANADAFIERIYKETGVPVFIIDQDLEGILAYNAVLTLGKYDPPKLIVWDIGGGSLQLIATDNQGRHAVFRGNLASIPFKNMIIQSIQRKDILQNLTPNPMSVSDIEQAISRARETAGKVDQLYKDLIGQSDVKVVGVGNIFAYGIYPMVGKKSPFTQEELHKALLNLANKNDQEVGGGDYANVQVSNAALVLGYMQGLGIQQMEALDVNNADEAMLYNEFWNT